MFAHYNLAADVTNILLQCRLYVVQRPGMGVLSKFLYKLVQGCVRIIGISFSPPDKVCFSTSNYMKSLYFHSNSPHNLQCTH